jgi:hypothetical protein
VKTRVRERERKRENDVISVGKRYV